MSLRNKHEIINHWYARIFWKGVAHKSGGLILATINFHSASDLSVMRARLSNGEFEQLLPPIYHGNPVSADGSLVFTVFGWGLLGVMKAAGFSDVAGNVYASAALGHLGGGQLVFRLVK